MMKPTQRSSRATNSSVSASAYSTIRSETAFSMQSRKNRSIDFRARKKDDRLLQHIQNIIVYQGGISRKKRKALTKQLEAAADDRIVLAIGECIGEGFDDSRLDTLFLALPISFHGRLEQYVGRLHRAHEGKSVVKIYDYVDAHIEKMYHMFRKRQATYKKIGYKMEAPI
jgi:superfamily II DNA or RNA helicase